MTRAVECVVVAGLTIVGFVVGIWFRSSQFPAQIPDKLIPRTLDHEGDPTPDHYVVCADRWLAADRAHCPEVKAQSRCEADLLSDAGTREFFQCSTMVDGGLVLGPQVGAFDRTLENCDVSGERSWERRTIRGVAVSVWEARCGLWLRGEYKFAPDSGVQTE